MELEEFDPDQYKGQTVREMHPEEQPREKLLKYGPESLSSAELLAILLRTGSKGMNVVDTSRALLDRFQGLRNLSKQDWQALKIIPGIAKVKALTLEAVFELTRRIQMESLGDEIKITTPEMAAAYFMPRLRDLKHEEFYVGFLNNSKVLTGYKKISSGGSTATVVEPAEVIRQAVLNQANSILLVHNHPSGYLEASQADIHLTERLCDAGDMLGIPIVDHIIIAGDGYISLRNKNIIK